MRWRVPIFAVAFCSTACTVPLPDRVWFDGAATYEEPDTFRSSYVENKGPDVWYGGYDVPHDAKDAKDVADVEADAITVPDCSFAPDPVIGEAGVPCQSPSDCDSGYCVESAAGPVCTRSCSGCCPQDWSCRPYNGLDTTFICLPKFPKICDPCATNGECNTGWQLGNVCMPMGGVHFCGQLCVTAADCPLSYDCTSVVDSQGGQSVQQCVPQSGMCSCSAKASALGTAIPCAVSNGFGNCSGMFKCAVSGPTACDAPTPATETCNGIDDDCNGTTDDVGTCDDGNACTIDACALAAPCTADSCDLPTGCTHTNAPAGFPCGDGAVCGADGQCIGAPAPLGMVLVPAGSFWMGCNAAKDACNPDESPQHEVKLSGYFIDVTETTVLQYQACVDAGVCAPPKWVQPEPGANYPGNIIYPVNFVEDWAQARKFCQWRGDGYDLPTEAQWEMAARGSCEKNGLLAGSAACAQSTRSFPWGDMKPTCDLAVMFDGTKSGCGTGATWAAGFKPAGNSPYGVQDMAGNVAEWTRDAYGAYAADAQTDPWVAAGAVDHVARGGDFTSSAAQLRAAARVQGSLVFGAGLGMRCVRSLP